jgi:co-chaperonin GroES (HSP10)
MVLCEMIAPRRSSGGLHLPDGQEDNTVRGKVLEVGPGAYQNGMLVPMRTKVGDVVLADWSQGHNIGRRGVGLVPETAILCTIENPTDSTVLDVPTIRETQSEDGVSSPPEPGPVLR